MKRVTEKQSRHSLTTQVVLWVVGFVSILFVAALFIMFHHARNSIYQETMEKARQTLRTTELRIDNTLNEVETATRSWHWTIEKRLNKPEIMDSLCQQLLRENPHIQSCTIAFEPGVYPQYGIACQGIYGGVGNCHTQYHLARQPSQREGLPAEIHPSNRCQPS